MKMVNFFISDMQKEIFNARILREPMFIKCFRNNISNLFFKDITTRDSSVMWIFGLTGSGKSAVAQSLILLIDPEFSVNRLVMTNDDLKEAVFKSGNNEGFIRDETARDFGEGSGQLISTIQDLVETLRQRRNSFILLSPVIKGQGFVHYYLEVLQSSVPLDRENIKDFIKNGGERIFFRVGVSDKLNNYLGYIIVESEINNPLWLDYQDKKEAFLKEMSSGERKTGLDYTKEALKFFDLIDVRVYPKKQDRLTFIKSNTNYTMGQCKTIHSEYERLLNLDRPRSNKSLSYHERLRALKNGKKNN